MKIGINALFIIQGHNGGTETYVRGLLDGLFNIDKQNEYFIFVNRTSKDSFQYDFKNVHLITCNIDGYSRIKRVLYEQLILPILVFKLKLDLLHSLGFVSPLFIPCRSVVTIHDLMHMRFPDTISKSKQLYWNTMIPLSLRKACKVITVSETIHQEMSVKFPLISKKTIVTHEGIQFQNSNKKNPVTGLQHFELNRSPFFLSVGTFAKHKNLITLVKAFHKLLLENLESPYRLVLVGGSGQTIESTYVELKNYIDDNQLVKKIFFTGRVDNTQLLALYQNAFCFVMPSLYEGFGLPVLEAMSQGCPVIASQRGSLQEVCGNAALLIDDAENPEAFKIAMLRMIHEKQLCEKMIEKGYARAKQFSFITTAQKTLECYRNAISL